MLGWLERRREAKRPPEEDWRHASAFASLSAAEHEVIAPHVTLRELKADEVLAADGTPATELFVIKSGGLKVLKPDGDVEHEVGRVGPGEVVGEVALIDELPRSATLQAVGPTVVWVVDFHALRPAGSLIARSSIDPRPKPIRSAYLRLLENLTTVMAERVRMQNELLREGAKQREVAARFLVSTLLIVCLYSFLENGLDLLGDKAPANTTMVSLPLQIVFGIGSWWFIRGTGYPLAQFGIGFRHFVGSLLEAILFTVPVLGVVTLIKQGVLWWTGNPGGVALVAHPDLQARFTEPDVIRWVGIYAVTCAVQELIVRGALQSSLEMFLTGPRRKLLAILVSAALFSMMHLHMSFVFATAAFVPGLFWGWLFSRRRNLAGVTLSHTAVGAYVFFVLGTAL